MKINKKHQKLSNNHKKSPIIIKIIKNHQKSQKIINNYKKS